MVVLLIHKGNNYYLHYLPEMAVPLIYKGNGYYLHYLPLMVIVVAPQDYIY